MVRQAEQGYQVKNTFVEVQIPENEAEKKERAVSEDTFDPKAATLQVNDFPLKEYLAAGTPSPFLHPAMAPNDMSTMMQMVPLPGLGFDSSMMADMPTAFGDLPADFDLTNAYDANSQGNYNQNFIYDPNTGMYMAYDWSATFGGDCINMMPVESHLGDEYGCVPYTSNGGNTEHLMAALSEKLHAGRDVIQSGMSPDCADGDHPDNYSELGVMQEGMENCQHDMGDMSLADMQAQPRGTRGGRKSRRDRDRGERANQARHEQIASQVANPATSELAQSDVRQQQPQQQTPVTFTTVMLRNIPNKYTREMLVKQLEQEWKGEFDFVYLPIDFKNRCNVGYAFINFRSIEACEAFVIKFNGVEVHTCLPGLNSRKVTEVTPARVQGFEDNVQRLRNSPVMRELAHHPEWMPLIFDEYGGMLSFPAPERPLEPIKPSRRGRDLGCA
jgi:hypothetical protein